MANNNITLNPLFNNLNIRDDNTTSEFNLENGGPEIIASSNNVVNIPNSNQLVNLFENIHEKADVRMDITKEQIESKYLDIYRDELE